MPASRLHPVVRMVLCAVALLAVLFLIQAVGLGVLLALPASPEMAALPITERMAQIAVTYALFLTVISYPLGMGVLYLFRTRVDKFSWRSLGFSRSRALPNFARGALTATLALSTLFALMWLAGIVTFGGWSTDAQTHSAAYALVTLLGFGIAFGAVGFFEETVFRGYALANLRQWLGWPFALIAQAVVFALVHLINGVGNPDVLRAAIAGLPNLFLIAVFFGLSYRKTGSLWFPIGFHVAWNWLLGCVFSLPVSGIPTFHLFDVQATGTSFLSGGLFGAEGSFFLTPLVMAMIYAMWLVPDHPRAVANLDTPELANAPAPQRAYDSSPTFSPIPAASTATEETAELRANRYNARFGSAQGFDSGMLNELKQMQEARDQAERDRLEAERAYRQAEARHQEEIRRAQIAAQTHALAVAEQTQAPTIEAVSSPVTNEEPTNPATEEVPSPPARELALPPTQTEATPIPVASEPTISRPEPERAASASATPQPETTPTTPSEAPPKKVRPRW